ncbi:hypothetical protein NDU88_003677 [Pleurodeles waltl]|uniref:Uncharacterized protein n=1 Tax=Pleurodeles waltl TaxID=8319 RepID=A0AAV7PA93_PLEWA|nr:hypothetical protein NDU88_003677 [Pleurodeles waltl]
MPRLVLLLSQREQQKPKASLFRARDSTISFVGTNLAICNLSGNKIKDINTLEPLVSKRVHTRPSIELSMTYEQAMSLAVCLPVNRPVNKVETLCEQACNGLDMPSAVKLN